MNEEYHNHAESRKVLERLLEVLAPDGTVLYRNERLGANEMGGQPATGEGVNGYSPRTIRMKDGSSVFIVSRRHSLAGRTLIIRVGYREDTVSSRIWEFLTASLTTLPVLLAITALFGLQLAGRSLAP